MPSVKRAIKYVSQYGLRSAIGLAREKMIIDPKRFSPDIKREVPDFKNEPNAVKLPDGTEKTRPYNVLYLVHYFYPERKGGTERFTLNIAKGARALGATPIVLVLDAALDKKHYTGSLGDILYRYYEYDGIRCIGVRYKKSPLGLYYKRIDGRDTAMREFASYILNKEKIDVVHATYPQPFTPFLLECKEKSVPYVVTCTDFCMMCHYSTMVDNTGAFCAGTECGAKCSRVCKTYGVESFAERFSCAKEVLSGASLVTVPSKFVSRVLSAEFENVGFLPVNHGIAENFKYRKGRTRVKKFVYAGTISQLKGIHLLISAFSRLQGDDLSLLIYGSGDDKYLKRLKSMADKRVKFFDAVSGEKMPEIYADADCVIIPSMWYETYNFVLREAANSGALVIASDIGAMSEAVKEGENGYLFKPADEEDLYRKMCLALDFNFENYKAQSYPTLKEEGSFYDSVYRKIIK